jgi:hypothetical protein
MAANPTVEMSSVGRWPGRCSGRMAAIVRMLCTPCTVTVEDKPNPRLPESGVKRGYGRCGTASDHEHIVILLFDILLSYDVDLLPP